MLFFFEEDAADQLATDVLRAEFVYHTHRAQLTPEQCWLLSLGSFVTLTPDEKAKARQVRQERAL